MMTQENIELHEEIIINDNIALVVGEPYESITSGQDGVLILADIEGDVYEIALANDIELRVECLARGVPTNYLWRGDYKSLVEEWVYVGQTIEGYEEAVVHGCCKIACGGTCENKEEDVQDDGPDHDILLDIILEVAKYSFDWLGDHPEEDPYRRYSIETLAHTIACFITHDFTGEATPTADIVDMIEDLPEIEVLRDRLIDYIEEVQDEVDHLTAIPSLRQPPFQPHH